MIISLAGTDTNSKENIFNKCKSLFADKIYFLDFYKSFFDKDISDVNLILNSTNDFKNLFLEYKKLNKTAAFHSRCLLDDMALSQHLCKENRDTSEGSTSSFIAKQLFNNSISKYDLFFLTLDSTKNNLNSILKKLCNDNNLAKKVVILSGSIDSQFKQVKKELTKYKLI